MRLNTLKNIIKTLEQSSIEEIEIKTLFSTVRVSKKGTGEVKVTESRHSETATKNTETNLKSADTKQTTEKQKLEEFTAIKAPMVGTFYHASAPSSPPYVEVGDRIQKGKVVCIIEAMKVMNEIEAETDGIIEKKLVNNGEPVEYGQKLFLVKP